MEKIKKNALTIQNLKHSAAKGLADCTIN